MSKILSQDEVRALLQQPMEGDDAVEPDDPPESSVTAHDFRDGERMPRSRVSYLQTLHDRFTQQLAISVSAFLKLGTTIYLQGIDQASSTRFVRQLVDPSVIYTTNPIEGRPLMLVLENELGLAFVDRMLGGAGAKPVLRRPLTEIELSVLRALADIVLSALRQAWRPMVDHEILVDSAETRPGLLKHDATDESFLILNLVVGLGTHVESLEGAFRIAIPKVVAEKISTELARDQEAERPEATVNEASPCLLAPKIWQMPVEFLAELTARGITARDLTQLQAGRVLKLGRAVDESATVRIGGVPKFKANLCLSRGRSAVEIRTLHEAD
jgi:flagellar motor switch protein FliM